MDIKEIKKFEPFWGKWVIDEKLGEGSYGAVYRIKSTDYNGREYYSALKVLSIPRDENERAEVEITCGTLEGTRTYFEEQLKKFEVEIELMNLFKGKTNIVSYEDHEIIPRTGENEVGFLVFMRMELLEDLRKVQRTRPQLLNNQIEIIKIGKDICSALEICETHNIIHRDIKPRNIMRSKDGDYKLGDFGVARSSSTDQTMTRVGTLTYMAPEVEYAKTYDARADIYSLGMVLYELLNGNRGPFLPAGTGKITAADKEQARERCMRGEELPLPACADARLGAVVKKACAFAPEQRYQTAREMRIALEDVENRMLHGEPEPPKTPAPIPAAVSEAPKTAGKKKKKKSAAKALIFLILLFVIVDLALAEGLFYKRNGYLFIPGKNAEETDADEPEDDDSDDGEKDREEVIVHTDTSVANQSETSANIAGNKAEPEQDLNLNASSDRNEGDTAERATVDSNATEDDSNITVCSRCGREVYTDVTWNPSAEYDAASDSYIYQEENHDYQLFVADCTWEEAESYCESMGGHLATITYWEEFARVQDMLETTTLGTGERLIADTGHPYHIWLGFYMELGASGDALTIVKSHTVTEDIGEYPGLSNWANYGNGIVEPTTTDPNTGVLEDKIAMYYKPEYSQNSDYHWVWNTLNNDISGYHAGRIAYLCEWEHVVVE